MIWITDEDLDMQIRAVVRNVVSGDSAEVMETAERAAIAEATSYLAGRYDTAAIFATEEDDRNPILKTYVIDLLLYHVHSRISPNNIPKLRENRYEQAIEWLKMVAADKLNPELPILAGQEGGNFKMGSKPKVSSWW